MPASSEQTDVTRWLLEGDPSVRFFTLTGCSSSRPTTPRLAAARRAIMTTGPVPAILAAQQADGHWEGPDRFYTAKYRGTVWTLLILAELGADGADARVRAACEAILRDAQDPDSGGFSSDRAQEGRRRPPQPASSRASPATWSSASSASACWTTRACSGPSTGSPPRALRRRRGRRAHRLALRQLRDVLGPPHLPHGRGQGAQGARGGPARAPHAGDAATISAGAEFFLRHHVHRRSHDLARDSKPGWRRFGFPLMYQTDALEILCILARRARPTCATSACAKRWTSSPPAPTPRAAGSSSRPSTTASSSPSRPRASRAAGSRCGHSRC